MPSRTQKVKKAVFAVAHSILVIAFQVLQRGEPYNERNELGGEYFVEHAAYQRRLVKHLERMGFEVDRTSKAAEQYFLLQFSWLALVRICVFVTCALCVP